MPAICGSIGPSTACALITISSAASAINVPPDMAKCGTKTVTFPVCAFSARAICNAASASPPVAGRRQPRELARSFVDQGQVVAMIRPPFVFFASEPPWRNGRRGRLKICCPQGRAGSSPAGGTMFRCALSSAAAGFILFVRPNGRTGRGHHVSLRAEFCRSSRVHMSEFIPPNNSSLELHSAGYRNTIGAQCPPRIENRYW